MRPVTSRQPEHESAPPNTAATGQAPAIAAAPSPEQRQNASANGGVSRNQAASRQVASRLLNARRNSRGAKARAADMRPAS